ncbi:hypothetical protein IV454_00005 [Massilia antarctica]|uniref:Extracellular repeat, HAF family n=1 Tax=Massilia antarctica TaxID=2765360 RepID=A0AA49A8G0_9BURK|nr:hypothetical protein [Massilia antarctica]QPI50071.1 hypothetical protein IV454_00005 [Massilia antarctica]
MSRALDVNNTGQVTGLSSVSSDSGPEHPYHAFLYSGEVMTDLGTLGGLYSTGYAINDRGAVVGDAGSKEEFPSGHAIPHAFLYVNGVMSDLAPWAARKPAAWPSTSITWARSSAKAAATACSALFYPEFCIKKGKNAVSD